MTNYTLATIQSTLEREAETRANEESKRLIDAIPYAGDEIEIFDVNNEKVTVSSWRVKETLQRAVKEWLFQKYLKEEIDNFTIAAQQIMAIRLKD
jgi:hypothetical protein